MATMLELLRLSLDERKAICKATDIEKVIIDNNTFTDYKAFTFLWEKSYVESPQRSADGTIGQLNNYPTFLTPHLKIDFSLLSIDDYRRLMQLVYASNEHTVTCYDIVNNTLTTNNMYFTTEEFPKLWTMARIFANPQEDYIELLGVDEYTVEMVGTNTEYNEVSITYHLNPPASTGQTDRIMGADYVPAGNDMAVGGGASGTQEETFDGAYTFAKWNTKADGSGTTYNDNSLLQANSNLVLYAQWQSTNIYTLSYDYGIGTKPASAVYSKTVQVNTAIGTLPNSALPDYEYDGYIVQGAYSGVAWYTLPTSVEGETALTAQSVLPNTTNKTIYQRFIKNSFTAKFYANGSDTTPLFTITAEVGAKLATQTPTSGTRTFEKWVYTKLGETHDFNGTMPPFNVNLIARWV